MDKRILWRAYNTQTDSHHTRSWERGLYDRKKTEEHSKGKAGE